MNEFDQFVKHVLRIKHYVRYTDDFILIGSNRAALVELLPSIGNFLSERLKIELHPDKIEIREYRKGVDFLGYVSFPRFRLLRKKTEQRMKSEVSKTIAEYKRGLIEEEQAEATLNSYVGMLTHADTHRLTEKLKNDFWLKMHS